MREHSTGDPKKVAFKSCFNSRMIIFVVVSMMH